MLHCDLYQQWSKENRPWVFEAGRNDRKRDSQLQAPSSRLFFCFCGIFCLCCAGCRMHNDCPPSYHSQARDDSLHRQCTEADMLSDGLHVSTERASGEPKILHTILVSSFCDIEEGKIMKHYEYIFNYIHLYTSIYIYLSYIYIWL